MQDQFRDRQREALRRQLGAELLGWLEDESIVEIMLNPDGRLWVDVLGEGMQCRGRMDAVRGQMVMDTVAAMLDRVVTENEPVLEGELPLDGSRFEGLVPPLVERPAFAIRKKASLVFTLEDYVRQGAMTADHQNLLRQAVRERRNILVCGGTGTGKTTLTNALLHAMAEETPEHRIVIIEDTRELQCSAENAVFLRTSETIDMTRLLRATMRLRPDRILVGEVRGGEALALLKAWNTGHPGGVGTVHANDAGAALVRLGQLIQEAGVPPVPELIAEAVDLVVSIKRTPQGRRIEEVMRVKGGN
ncbi:MAG: P-type conjugative transfer ATPase TrbB [Acidihalobacter sp.]|uniref:P-type conjugative transfer ATPase TrbB n=1 Tax=Acidihalobacter sp. TaxID=1872108 RepID=UPI00307F58D6